jgi:hypothetical protein
MSYLDIETMAMDMINQLNHEDQSYYSNIQDISEWRDNLFEVMKGAVT